MREQERTSLSMGHSRGNSGPHGQWHVFELFFGFAGQPNPAPGGFVAVIPR